VSAFDRVSAVKLALLPPPSAEKATLPTAPAAALSIAPQNNPASNSAKAPKKNKGKGLSLQEFNNILDSSAKKAPLQDFSVWGKTIDANAPSAGIVSAKDGREAKQFSLWGAKDKVTESDLLPGAMKEENEGIASGVPVSLKMPAPSSLAMSGIKSTTSKGIAPSLTTSPQPKATPGEATISEARRTRGLLDFLPASGKKTLPAAAATPVPSPTKAWSAPTASTPTLSKAKFATSSSSSTSSVPTSAKPAPISFSDIQKTEESARKTSTIASFQGNSVPWYVERRKRADSLEEVLRQQAWEKAEEEEIARAIAEIDRQAALVAAAEAKKRSAKSSKATRGKK
jgi:hypothetical protein